MIQPPSTRIEYHIKDAGIFWSSHDDSVNVYDSSTEDMICISGVGVDEIWRMCRNLMCAAPSHNIFSALEDNKGSTLDYAKEMLNALTNYIKEKDEATV